MSTDFANFWRKQTHTHNAPQLVLYVRTVLCKNWQRFLRHTVQRQVYQVCIKITLVTSDNYQVTSALSSNT